MFLCILLHQVHSLIASKFKRLMCAPMQVSHPSALGLQEGQDISVKYFGRDPASGKIRLSRKALYAGASTVIKNLINRSWLWDLCRNVCIYIYRHLACTNDAAWIRLSTKFFFFFANTIHYYTSGQSLYVSIHTIRMSLLIYHLEKSQQHLNNKLLTWNRGWSNEAKMAESEPLVPFICFKCIQIHWLFYTLTLQPKLLSCVGTYVTGMDLSIRMTVIQRFILQSWIYALWDMFLY